MANSQPQKPRRPAKTSRRNPTQERSANLVCIVLEATAQVLAEVGHEATSTNKIAKRAGVAVGSIYQYFPNKEAVFDALVDDRIHRLETMVAERIAALQTLSYPEAAEAVLRATIEFHASEPAVTPMLVNRTMAPQLRPEDQHTTQRLHDISRSYLATSAAGLDVADLDLAATISMHVVGHFAPFIALSVSGDAERERFISGVVRMLSTWVDAAERMPS